ncbi:hypothetical protein YC2023_111689 [Brassica napus]
MFRVGIECFELFLLYSNILISTHPTKVKQSLLLDVPTHNTMVKKPPRANRLESIKLQ